MAKTLHARCRGPRFDPWSATRSHVPPLACCNEARATAKTQCSQTNKRFFGGKNSGDKISWEFFVFCFFVGALFEKSAPAPPQKLPEIYFLGVPRVSFDNAQAVASPNWAPTPNWVPFVKEKTVWRALLQNGSRLGVGAGSRGIYVAVENERYACP